MLKLGNKTMYQHSELCESELGDLKVLSKDRQEINLCFDNLAEW